MGLAEPEFDPHNPCKMLDVVGNECGRENRIGLASNTRWEDED